MVAKISLKSDFLKLYVVVPIFLVAILLLMGTAHSTKVEGGSNRPIAYLSYEDSSWKSDTTCCKWLYDPWNNNTFRIPMQGDRTYVKSWISTTMSNEGRKSLGVWLKTNPSVKEKQRAEFEISNGKYYTQYLEESRYYGVALYIHPQSSEKVSRGTIFMQAWQSHDTTYSKHPPFFLRFNDDSDYQWTVNISRDSENDTRYTKGTPETIYTSLSGLQKGVWHEFIVWFKPSIESKGAIRVWYNGELAVSQTHQRNFGYAPRSTFPVMNNKFAVRYGAYRTSLPEEPGDIILMYDQGKFGTSYESVDP